MYKHNEGKTIAINYALDVLIGKEYDILFILDSDDEILPWFFEHIATEFEKNSTYVSYHYKCIFPKWIKRKSELATDAPFLIVTYEMLLCGTSHKGDFPGCINLHTLGNTRFEPACPNGLEYIFWLRLAKKGKSKYINIPFIFVDSSFVPGKKKDNLTSFAYTFKRAKQMIRGYDILIEENKKEAMRINPSILGKRYKDQFFWCIIAKDLQKGISIIKTCKPYLSKQEYVGMLFLVSAFFFPNILLKIALKWYYTLK